MGDPSPGALSGFRYSLPGEGTAQSGGWENEPFNLKRVFLSQPCCELTMIINKSSLLLLWPGSQLEEHAGWIWGIERDFLVDTGWLLSVKLSMTV